MAAALSTPETPSHAAANKGALGRGGRASPSGMKDLSAALTVFYKTKGSAIPDVDYKALSSGTVTIQPGASTAKIKIKPIDNTKVDGTRKAKIVLLPTGNNSYSVIDPSVAKVKIFDDD